MLQAAGLRDHHEGRPRPQDRRRFADHIQPVSTRPHGPRHHGTSAVLHRRRTGTRASASARACVVATTALVEGTLTQEQLAPCATASCWTTAPLPAEVRVLQGGSSVPWRCWRCLPCTPSVPQYTRALSRRAADCARSCRWASTKATTNGCAACWAQWGTRGGAAPPPVRSFGPGRSAARGMAAAQAAGKSRHNGRAVAKD